MSSAKIAAFDLDEVLCDLKVATHAALLQVIPNYPPPAQWSSYNCFEQHGLSLDQFLNILIEHQVLENAPPVEHAAEVLRALKDLGYRNAVVTARGYHPTGVEVTQAWFKQHGLPIDDLIVVDMLESKVDALKSLGKVKSYCDDLPMHLNNIAAAQCVEELYLMRRPWNAHSFNYRVVRDLTELSSAIAFVSPLSNKNNNKEHGNAVGVGGQSPGR